MELLEKAGIEQLETTVFEIMSWSDAQVKDIIAVLSNPLLAILTGFAITAIIQSSSASVGILISMAGAGLITDLPMVFFMILGCNIGSCVTALIVSLSGRKEAKRTAIDTSSHI